MRLKQYGDFNKVTWFLFPLIIEPFPNITRIHYLVDKYLENVFVNSKERKLYVVYKNVPEVVDIEGMLTTDYLIDVEEHTTHTIFIYQIREPDIFPSDASKEDIIKYEKALNLYHENAKIFDMVIEGKYSKLPARYKFRIGLFFLLNREDYIIRVFRRDELLYLTRYKLLGCFAKGKCTCKINTYKENMREDGKDIERDVCTKIQDFLGCDNFEKFEMPDLSEDFELEEKPDLNKEEYDGSKTRIQSSSGAGGV